VIGLGSCAALEIAQHRAASVESGSVSIASTRPAPAARGKPLRFGDRGAFATMRRIRSTPPLRTISPTAPRIRQSRSGQRGDDTHFSHISCRDRVTAVGLELRLRNKARSPARARCADFFQLAERKLVESRSNESHCRRRRGHGDLALPAKNRLRPEPVLQRVQMAHPVQ